MINSQLAELHKPPKKEKIKLLHILWENTANEQDYELLPLDHISTLNERLEKIYKGIAEFISRVKIHWKYQYSDEI